MSVETLESGRIVHYPKRRSVFEFDAEVSRIFPDMAMRSIPMYEEAHRLHISMFESRIRSQPRTVFYDVGASRGQFFKALCNRFQIDSKLGDAAYSCTAIDTSIHMLAQLKEEMPWVHTIEADAAYLVDFDEPADFISMFYVLQFIESDTGKLNALKWAYRNLKPGGVLFLGQKDLTTETHTTLFAEEYYRFRTDNGYTMDEIRAKTEALKGSMWPITPARLEDLCFGARFIDYVETTRWLTFSTSMCTK